MKILGAIVLTLGVLFLISCWTAKKPAYFAFELIFGPIFIHFGLQLLS